MCHTTTATTGDYNCHTTTATQLPHYNCHTTTATLQLLVVLVPPVLVVRSTTSTFNTTSTTNFSAPIELFMFEFPVDARLRVTRIQRKRTKTLRIRREPQETRKHGYLFLSSKRPA